MSMFLLMALICINCDREPDLVAPSITQVALDHWKLTLPTDKDADGNADEYVYPFDYHTNNHISPYLYDSPDGALVFFCSYSGIATPNSKYSRTELREQLVPGDNTTNWTLDQGGTLSGTLKVPEISTGHRTIIMQIHGRLSHAQKTLLGTDDSDAPPLLKVYFQDSKIRVARKVLVDENSSDLQILEKTAWVDDEAFYFDQKVNDNTFDLQIIVSSGRMEIKLNEESKVYEDTHLQKWPFENYFKAGNYLQSTEQGAYAQVWFYSLNVSH